MRTGISKVVLLFACFLLLSPGSILGGDSKTEPSLTGRHWLFLEPEDYAPAELERALEETARNLTPRSLKRRRKVIDREPPVRVCDLPVSRERIEAIEKTGCRIVRSVRYLNAVTVAGTPNELKRVGQIEWVSSIRPVFALPALQVDDIQSEGPQEGFLPLKNQNSADDQEDYGFSWTQINLVNIPEAHNRGYRGAGVLIGVQDTGFDFLEHNCFRNLTVVAAYDFLNDDDNVDDQGDLGSGRHGTMTLSVIAGLDSGSYIGVAPDAEFALTKTENSEAEYPAEEDVWVAGLWFHDSLGVEVLSSSLSYRDWYDYEDMDGRTAVTTRAADSAAAAGIVIVNSAGNTGLQQYPHSKIGAPADGRLVIAAGGVRRDSSYWTQSSQGPTFDGRIKPDVAAMSSGVFAASNTNAMSYLPRSGTSFSCPTVAGVAALMLQANPFLTPPQVISILHQTGSRAQNPDTLTGFGVVDAYAAVLRAEALNHVPDRRSLPEYIQLSVYPNPLNGKTNLILKGIREIQRLSVYDSGGRRVVDIFHPDAAGGVLNLDLRSLSSGLYMFTAEGINYRASGKLVLLP